MVIIELSAAKISSSIASKSIASKVIASKANAVTSTKSNLTFDKPQVSHFGNDGICGKTGLQYTHGSSNVSLHNDTCITFQNPHITNSTVITYSYGF